MSHQLTFWTGELHFFQLLNPTFDIQLEIITQGILSDTYQASNLLMGQAVTLQPQGFHSALHQRHRMSVPFFVYHS